MRRRSPPMPPHAAARAGVPLARARRPAWEPVDRRPLDRGRGHAGGGARRSAARRAASSSRSAATSLRPFEAAPQHLYLVRSVDPVEPPLALPHADYLTGRGPFGEADERALLARHRIDVIVAKNSGGAATYGKIAAARALGLPVIMLRRPPPRAGVGRERRGRAGAARSCARLRGRARRVDERRAGRAARSRASRASRR